MKLLRTIKNYLASFILNEPPIFCNLLRWHEFFIKRLGSQRGAYLEFGVYAGNSALSFYRALFDFYNGKIPDGAYPMYLFDSFCGLPKNINTKDIHPQWYEGKFDVGGGKNFIEAVTKKGLPREKFVIIEGFYEETLKKFKLPESLKASIVNIDCDYYSSTKLVLTFLRPYLQNGTLLYFDDLLAFSGNPYKGQIAAINEFNHENTDIGLAPCPAFNNKYEGRVFWAWVNK